MDIQKQKNLYLVKLLEQEVIKQDEFDDLVFKPEINAFHSIRVTVDLGEYHHRDDLRYTTLEKLVFEYPSHSPEQTSAQNLDLLFKLRK